MALNEQDDSDDEGAAKLFPEWGVRADNQIVLGGLAVFAAMLLFFGWNAWRGSDDDAVSTASSILSDPPTGDEAVAAPEVAGTAITDDGSDSASSTETDSDSAAAASASSTTAAADDDADAGDLQAIVAGLPGAITATSDDGVAVLEGFVSNDGEYAAAEQAALAADGVDEVDNNLALLEPSVLEALREAGAVAESANGVGTEIAVGGFVQSEEDRQAVLDAAAAVEGVTAVEDRLELSVAADLNALPQVQFATASADILPASFADLNAAAQLIQGAGEVQLLVAGWTDTRGDAEANLELSRARAEAVVTYLIEAGVPGSQLASVGNGETDEFAEGDSPEALQANRVVLFQQTG